MGIAQGHTQRAGQRTEVVARRGRQHDGGQVVGVDRLLVVEQALLLQKTKVEVDVVSQDGVVADEALQLREHLSEARGSGQHVVGDAGELGDERGEGATGVDQCLKLIFDTLAGEADGADFDDAVTLGVEASGLQVKRNQGLHRMRLAL